MIKYWPHKQSADLNLAVANLFIQTYQKFSLKTSNQTTNYLPIDILSLYTKKKLFLETLIEFEILLLDIIELNLNIKQINQLHNQILYDLIDKTMNKFIYELKIKDNLCRINFVYNYNKLFFYEQSNIIQKLLTYLIFGSNYIEDNTFPFYQLRTPIYHVKILFENSIIQISNIITFNLLESCKSIQQISNFLNKQYLWNSQYKSIRDISNFRNNIISYNWINFYIYYPNDIYCSQYQIWLFSSKGITFKYIHLNRINDYIKLSNLQLSAIIYLELQDFIIPRLNALISGIGNLIIYIINEIISKSFKICFNKILNKFSTTNKNN